MAHSNAFTLAAPTQHLRQLTVIRSLLLLILWVAFGVGVWANLISHGQLLAILLALSFIHLLTILRLKNPLDVTAIEFFIQLLIDVIGLNLLFYYSGGANNPFISYLLVPICISAATLPWRFTWSIAAICILAYAGLLFFYVELPLFSVSHMHHTAATLPTQSPTPNYVAFNWHILGMWFNFFLSAVLITYFVVKMANTVRQQHEQLTLLREDELRNEQLLAVAIVAAGTAHEINTPLSTMKLVLDELHHEHQHNKSLHDDIELLSEQVNHCASTLKKMVLDADAATKGEFKLLSARKSCEIILDQWQLLRPQLNIHIDYTGDQLENNQLAVPYLNNAIINLLNNAADASPEKIAIHINCSQHRIHWQITDFGQGITQDIAQTLGKKVFSNKHSGLGIGMIITHATIKHYGGSVSQRPNNPQGTITDVIIPLRSA